MRHILICSFLEEPLVDRIRGFRDDLVVHYRPDLIPTPRYAADHIGAPFSRDPAQREAFSALMAQAEVLFDFDYADVEGMVRDGRRVRWVQASSAGIGGFVRSRDLARMGATFTTAAGVHARPLAEFVLFSMLAFVKRYPIARRQQRDHLWQRFAGDELGGKTLAIVGLGSIGLEVARQARLHDVRVIATKRVRDGADAAALGVDRLVPRERLHDLLSEADFVCLAAPATPLTDNMIDAAALAAMKPGAVLINIGRGSLVDEAALIAALRDGRLAGAVLDVAATEPLPADHPLWTLDNVIVFPHSASTSCHENERLTELFLDNLGRYLDGRPLRNVFDADRMY